MHGQQNIKIWCIVFTQVRTQILSTSGPSVTHIYEFLKTAAMAHECTAARFRVIDRRTPG